MKNYYNIIIKIFIGTWVTCSSHVVMTRGMRCALPPYMIIKNQTVEG